MAADEKSLLPSRERVRSNQLQTVHNTTMHIAKNALASIPRLKIQQGRTSGNRRKVRF
jgi:hypothetical protein